MSLTYAIQKNIPLKMFDAVTPANAAESLIYALPAVCNLIEVIASLATPGAAATSTVSISIANDVAGPWELWGSALVPNTADPTKSAVASVAAVFVKASLASVTVDGSTLTLAIVAKG